MKHRVCFPENYVSNFNFFGVYLLIFGDDQSSKKIISGHLTEAGIKVQHQVRLRRPYESKCVNEFPSAYAKFTTKHETYSIRDCRLACIDSYLYESCKCVDKINQEVKEHMNLKCRFFTMLAILFAASFR